MVCVRMSRLAFARPSLRRGCAQRRSCRFSALNNSIASLQISPSIFSASFATYPNSKMAMPIVSLICTNLSRSDFIVYSQMARVTYCVPLSPNSQATRCGLLGYNLGWRFVVVMKSNCIFAFALFLVIGTISRADVIISSGYYDLSPAQSGGGPALPNPWYGSANTTFYGSASDISAATSSDPDISGLLFQNTGSTSVTLSALGLSGGLNVLGRGA